MSITCGYFNSINGDRKYNAETMTRYFEGLISDGVYNSVGDKLKVSPSSDMSINVATGRAMISCRWIHNSSALNLSLEPADTRLQRYDAVVLHLDLNDNVRDFTIKIKTGENALDNPIKPTITNTSLIKELCLAYIYVGAGVSNIKLSKIEDMRGSELCPWVTGLIQQVDTSNLFTQFNYAYLNLYENWSTQFDELLATKQLEFNNWFNTLTQTLGVDVSVKSYQNVVQTTTTVKQIQIGIAEYQTGDILQVNVNGIILNQNSEYTIIGEGAIAKINLVNTLESDNIVTFVVIKSVVGSGSGINQVVLWDTAQYSKYMKLVKIQDTNKFTTLTTIENAVSSVASLCSDSYNHDLVLSSDLGLNTNFNIVCNTQCNISADTLLRVKYRADNTNGSNNLSVMISNNQSVCSGTSDSNYIGTFEPILSISTLDNYIEVLLKPTTAFTQGNYYIQLSGTAKDTQFRVQSVEVVSL